MQLSDESAWIDQALSQARLALLLASPNPRVGCVIVGVHGQMLGCGHTQRAGGGHAEIVALRDAAQRGHSVVGSTVYLTLEPCSHHGRTGSCCDALIEAGVAKVVASREDPNPRSTGQGFSRLRAAGVDVVNGPGDEESRELNIGFFSRIIRGVPWVRLKVAASLDGATALSNGASQWITSEEARADGHAWRARACAVLTGIGTVLDDNPRLDVRDVPTFRQPHVVIVDSQLKTPPDARLLSGARNCYVYTASEDDSRKVVLEARGATVIYMPHTSGKVDLSAMLRDLGRRGINELHVEAGHRLNGSLVREGLVDELLVYLAPLLLGRGFGMVSHELLETLADGLSLEFKSVDFLGPDLRIVARVKERERF